MGPMSVYVGPIGNRRLPKCNLRCCHLMAITDDELEKMARFLHLDPRWRHGDHYDISAGKRSKAIAAGAIVVDDRFLVALRKQKR